jgi:hypothetical protein
MRLSIPLFSLMLVLLACQSASFGQELFSGWSHPAEVSVTIGRNEVLIPAGRHGLNYFPDEAICILKERPLTFTVVADGTYVMQGQSFASAVPVAHVLKPGAAGSPDNHYAGIGGIYDDTARKRVMGFYHAEDKEGIGVVEVNGVQGFYGTICAAEASTNDTAFRKLGPAISADKPKLPRGWETEGGPRGAWLAQGVGEPSVCVDATGKYLHCYFVEWSNRLKRGVQICVARCSTDSGGIPGSWQKYYNGRFSEPGLGGHETPVVSAGHQADAYTPHVQYVKEWQRYVMVFGVGVQSEIHARPLKPIRSGLYVTTSRDGVNWAKPVQVEKVFAFVINTQECKVHPTLIVSRVKDETLTGQLLYGFTPRWPDTPHHLGGCSISVRFTPQTAPATLPLESFVKMAKSSKRNSQGQVVELDLSGVKLGDAEIAALGQMTSLRRLTAPQTGLSDEHVGRLTSLANLTSLGLWQTQIGNDGLKIIGQLRNLSYLSVEGNRGVTDNGLAHLIGCERLSWLGLSYTGVSDNGMRHLAALSLTRLDLKGTKITNAGLQHIARIKSLRTISLANTRVTDTGVTEFQRALPNCKVEH